MPIQPSKRFTPPVSRGGGFSGTVKNPASVTVDKGLVTRVASGTPSDTGGGSPSPVTPTSFQVLVDANDTTPGFLSVKIVSGSYFAWTVNGSPGNETYTVGFTAQSANTVLAGPASGASATPTYRLLVPSDLPIATTSALGAVQPDGVTILVSGGVISAPGAGGGLPTLAELTGNSGSLDYSLTNSLATIQPVGSSPLGVTLTGGKYLLLVTLAVSGTTAGDQIEAQAYNSSTSTAVLTSIQNVQMTGSGEGELELTFLVSVTATNSVVVQAANVTAARGVVKMARSKIDVLQVGSASTSVPQVVISSFTPIFGLSGTTITITGFGFTGATAVTINGSAASSFTVVSDTQITATVPVETVGTSGPVTVTTAAGTATSAQSYFYQSTSPVGVKGYIAGGFGTSTVTAIGSKVVYSTDTTSAVSSVNLGTATRNIGAVGDGSMNGFMAGGFTTNYTTTIYKTAGATDTTSTLGGTLPIAQAYWGCGGLSNRSTTGFMLGGVTISSASAGVTTGATLTFATNTAATAASSLNLSVARLDAAYLNASSWGYAIAGSSQISSPTLFATGDKVVFGTSTTSAVTSSNATVAANWTTGNSGDGSTKGYLLGYFSGSSSFSTIDKTTYSTDTTAVIAATLSTTRAYGGAQTDGTSKSYMIGGTTNGGTLTPSVTADKIAFSTDTVSAVSSANLGTAVSECAAFSDSGI